MDDEPEAVEPLLELNDNCLILAQLFKQNKQTLQKEHSRMTGTQIVL